jgi:hypothetical protein
MYKAAVALADAFTVDRTLRKVNVIDNVHPHIEHVGTKNYVRSSCQTFSNMVRVNTSINWCMPAPNGSRKVEIKLALEHYGQLCIEQHVNAVDV